MVHTLTHMSYVISQRGPRATSHNCRICLSDEGAWPSGWTGPGAQCCSAHQTASRMGTVFCGLHRRGPFSSSCKIASVEAGRTYVGPSWVLWITSGCLSSLMVCPFMSYLEGLCVRPSRDKSNCLFPSCPNWPWTRARRSRTRAVRTSSVRGSRAVLRASIKLQTSSSTH